MPPQGSARSTKTLAVRYAPFLAIIALQLVLVTITPRNSTKTVQQGTLETGAAAESGVSNGTGTGAADQGTAAPTATPGAAAQGSTGVAAQSTQGAAGRTRPR